MFKVKNKSKEPRKFRDKFSGKDIIIEPGKSVITSTPVLKSEIFHVEKLKEEIKTKEKSKEEEDK